jgi:hypothetical protein
MTAPSDIAQLISSSTWRGDTPHAGTQAGKGAGGGERGFFSVSHRGAAASIRQTGAHPDVKALVRHDVGPRIGAPGAAIHNTNHNDNSTSTDMAVKARPERDRPPPFGIT